MHKATTASRILLPFAAALTLAACGGAEEETTYEADVVDESGELIVTDPDAPGIEDLTLPETPMTPVPTETAPAEAAPAETPEPAAE